MKNLTLLILLFSALAMASCGHYSENIEKGKKAKCKLEELQKQLAADPANTSLDTEIKQNLDWIKFYREDSGNPTKFDEELAAHKCS